MLEAITDQIIRYSTLEVNLTQKKVTCRGTSVRLTDTKFDLLAILVENPDMSFFANDLYLLTRGRRRFDGYDPTGLIKTYMNNIRVAFREARLFDEAKMIKCLPGEGYRIGPKDQILPNPIVGTYRPKSTSNSLDEFAFS